MNYLQNHDAHVVARIAHIKSVDMRAHYIEWLHHCHDITATNNSVTGWVFSPTVLPSDSGLIVSPLHDPDQDVTPLLSVYQCFDIWQIAQRNYVQRELTKEERQTLLDAYIPAANKCGLLVVSDSVTWQVPHDAIVSLSMRLLKMYMHRDGVIAGSLYYARSLKQQFNRICKASRFDSVTAGVMPWGHALKAQMLESASASSVQAKNSAIASGNSRYVDDRSMVKTAHGKRRGTNADALQFDYRNEVKKLKAQLHKGSIDHGQYNESLKALRIKRQKQEVVIRQEMKAYDLRNVAVHTHVSQNAKGSASSPRTTSRQHVEDRDGNTATVRGVAVEPIK